MKINFDYSPTPQELAESFANLADDGMLAFFEHVTAVYKRDCPRGVYALYDQFLAVVRNKDMSKETLTALAHLQRDSLWELQNYKP